MIECQDCHYWLNREERIKGAEFSQRGECHLLAPRYVEYRGCNAIWPKTKLKDACTEGVGRGYG